LSWRQIKQEKNTDHSLSGERSDQESTKKGKVVSTDDLSFWQNRQNLAIKKVKKK
jgi:hypothetical protein